MKNTKVLCLLFCLGIALSQAAIAQETLAKHHASDLGIAVRQGLVTTGAFPGNAYGYGFSVREISLSSYVTQDSAWVLTHTEAANRKSNLSATQGKLRGMDQMNDYQATRKMSTTLAFKKIKDAMYGGLSLTYAGKETHHTSGPKRNRTLGNHTYTTDLQVDSSTSAGVYLGIFGGVHWIFGPLSVGFEGSHSLGTAKLQVDQIRTSTALSAADRALLTKKIESHQPWLQQTAAVVVEVLF